MSMDYTVGDTIYMKFTTRQFSTGTPFILDDSPVLSAYEDASVTQITAGVSLTVDLDSVTGLNLATIVATGGNGFEVNKHYAIVITTGTVDSVSVVGEVVGEFTLSQSAAAVAIAAGVDAVKISGSPTAADNLQRGTEGLVLSTCKASSTTTTIETNLTEATNSHYNGRIVTFTDNALAGQSSDITAYNGTTKALTVTALTEAPASGDSFVIN